MHEGIKEERADFRLYLFYAMSRTDECKNAGGEVGERETEIMRNEISVISGKSAS